MGSLFCLFKMGLTLNRKKTLSSKPGVTHHPLPEQRPSVSPANKSRILRMLVYLRGFRESCCSNTRDDAAPSPPETDLSNDSTESDVDSEHNNSSDSSEESANLTNDTPNSSFHEQNHSNQRETKQPSAEPTESTLTVDARQFQSKFISVCLTRNDNHNLEVENLIPPEYSPETPDNMFLGAKETVDNQRVDNEEAYYQQTSSNGLENNTDAAHTHSSQAEFLLTDTLLRMHTSYYNEADSMHNAIPQGPYPFMADPNHPAPEVAVHYGEGVGIYCPDGCVDCEVGVRAVSKSKRLVYNWFEKYFTVPDLHLARCNDHHQQITYLVGDFTNVEYMDAGSGKPDYLYGVTDAMEFYEIKTLYDVKEPARMHPSEMVVAHMKRAEIMSGGLLSYFHGFNYNVIVAEYEPRYLPSLAVSYDRESSMPIKYQGIKQDPIRPVWEARGRIAPGQAEAARMMHARNEYRRQWTMYHKQDDARMRYVEEVLREAAAEHELAMRS